MKKLGLFICFLFVSTLIFAQNATEYSVDVAKTTLKWDAKKVVGAHHGTVNLKNGKLQLNGSKISGGNFIIDMPSLVCLDNGRVTGHLKNEDFFDVEKYPTATFIITKVEGSDTNPKITGRLTIKGITKVISFPATVSVKDNAVHAEANITVNRLEYDIRYRSSSFFENLGNRAIEDNFIIKLNMVANK